MLLKNYTNEELICKAELSDDPFVRELARRLAKLYMPELPRLSELPVELYAPGAVNPKFRGD